MIYPENILICISIPLLVVSVFVRGSARKFAISSFTGMIVSLLAAYITGFLNMKLGWEYDKSLIFISPVVEEILKFAPMIFYVFMFDAAEEEYAHIALGIGAGFATFENCCYLIVGETENLRIMAIRGMAVGVMHLISMLILAAGLIIARRFKALTYSVTIGVLSFSMTIHALYNLLVSQPGVPANIGFVFPVCLAVLSYVPYKRLRYRDNENS